MLKRLSLLICLFCFSATLCFAQEITNSISSLTSVASSDTAGSKQSDKTTSRKKVKKHHKKIKKENKEEAIKK